MNHTESFLHKFQRSFGSSDKLPGEFAREVLFNHIKIGMTVGIITPHGRILQGVARIHNKVANCFVLNTGGPHGTPQIATEKNTVYIPKADKILNLQ